MRSASAKRSTKRNPEREIELEDATIRRLEAEYAVVSDSEGFREYLRQNVREWKRSQRRKRDES